MTTTAPSALFTSSAASPPARAVVLAYLRDGQPRSMRDLAALAAGEKTDLVREDIQYVLRQLIEEGRVRQHAPETDGASWTYTLKDPLFALP